MPKIEVKFKSCPGGASARAEQQVITKLSKTRMGYGMPRSTFQGWAFFKDKKEAQAFQRWLVSTKSVSKYYHTGDTKKCRTVSRRK